MRERTYNISRMEAPMYERYDKAVDSNDTKELEWFAQFGTSKRESQMIANAVHYEKYLECGYTQRPILNEHGWIVNGSCMDLEKKAEVVSVFSEGGCYAEVRMLQHPNGKWVSPLCYSLSQSGGGSYPSVWDKQYPTRLQALNAALDRLIFHIEHDGVNGDKKYLPTVKKMRGDTIQLTLF